MSFPKSILIGSVVVGVLDLTAQYAVDKIYLYRSRGGKGLISWPNMGSFQFVSPLEPLRIHYAIGFGSRSAEWLYWLTNAVLWGLAAALVLMACRRIFRRA